MARPVWKGHLSFGLVTIPVALFPAEGTETTLDLDMLDSRDKSRVRYQRVNEHTGKEVPWNMVVKGFKLDGGYVVLRPDDFKAAAAEVSKGLEIVEFVDRDAVSPVYFEKPYYLAPTKGGEKGYALLREALKATERMGIAKLVIHTREHLAGLLTDGDALILVTIRFSQSLRAPEEVGVPKGSAAKVTAKEIDLAKQFVAGMYGPWRPEQYHDSYGDSLRKVIAERARHGDKARPPSAPQPAKEEGGDMMEMLRRSIEGGSRHAPHKRTRAGARRHSKRRAHR